MNGKVIGSEAELVEINLAADGIWDALMLARAKNRRSKNPRELIRKGDVTAEMLAKAWGKDLNTVRTMISQVGREPEYTGFVKLRVYDPSRGRNVVALRRVEKKAEKTD